ncbi:MAG: Ig-like domain-containing protein, partial [Elusimicrobia bacterium]|nr:Ig-like domain-containing protein [Elusimicrobiota bacterium]
MTKRTIFIFVMVLLGMTLKAFGEVTIDVPPITRQVILEIGFEASAMVKCINPEDPPCFPAGEMNATITVPEEGCGASLSALADETNEKVENTIDQCSRGTIVPLYRLTVENSHARGTCGYLAKGYREETVHGRASFFYGPYNKSGHPIQGLYELTATIGGPHGFCPTDSPIGPPEIGYYMNGKYLDQDGINKEVGKGDPISGASYISGNNFKIAANVHVCTSLIMLLKDSGDNQTGGRRQVLPLPLSVRLIDGKLGIPIQGALITFSTTPALGPGASVNPSSEVTDSSGIARTFLTLGESTGAYTVTATYQDYTCLGGQQTVAFTAQQTETREQATRLVKHIGDASGTVGQALLNPLAVRVVNIHDGKGEAGFEVNFSIIESPP